MFEEYYGGRGARVECEVRVRVRARCDKTRQDNDRRESRRRDHWATMCFRLAYQVLVPAFVHADTHTTVRPESGPTLATKSLTDHCNY